MSKLPQYEAGKVYNISPQGLDQILQRQRSSKYPGQDVIWTDDIRVELPIRLGTSGLASLPPRTIIDEWALALEKYGKNPALSVKRNNKWVTLTYEDFYQESMKFARSLVAHNVPEFAAISIIGFNAPEWLISFYGSIFARCIPVGIYTTNSLQACEYIARHSQTRIVVAENRELAKKYHNLLQKGQIQKIVLYKDEVGENNFGGKILTWSSFLQAGKNVQDERVQERKRKIKPGQCCFLCYTSGTTSMPKGVMISHDNCTWTTRAAREQEGTPNIEGGRIVSYLPLSHAAASFIDGFVSLLNGHHVYFAEPTALQGTLIQTLLQVRPHLFFTVPRLWEKIYIKLRQEESKRDGIAKKILTWAQSLGEKESLRHYRGEPTSWQFKLAKKIVFDKVKAAIGLDQAVLLAYGSAPIDPAVRKYFMSMNFVLMNGYGMTQTSAPHSSTCPARYNPQKPEDYLQVGQVIPGTETKIKKEKETDQQGQICMRGRNVCMGYFKNAETTSQTIDSQGYLHSGDLGRLDKDDFLFITGRAKELIITAGGENIPPILIENQIKKVLPCLSNVMLVGDNRHFLTCLVSLLEDPPFSGTIEKTAQQFLASKNLNVTTVRQARESPALRTIILQGLKEANKKAISRAQMVQNFYLMPQDFSIQNGTLTANFKLKRKMALKKYEKQIDQMYTTSKL